MLRHVHALSASTPFARPPRPGALRAAVGTLTVALALTGWGATALAYCHRASCAGAPGLRCVPAQETDCGVAVRWPSPCVSFSLHEDGAPQAAQQARLAALRSAFAAWMAADCGGQRPGLRVEHLGPVACGEHEYNRRGGNANVVAFPEPWPGSEPGEFGWTQLTYERASGAILDADMRLNPANLEAGPMAGGDLTSTALHEAGHFLGLAHSAEPSAVMSGELDERSASKRALTPDDEAAICALYPPGPLPAACDGTPRGGLRQSCAGEEDLRPRALLGLLAGAGLISTWRVYRRARRARW